MTRYADKATARQAVWDALAEGGHARFPTPPHGRIPNFAGAADAARRIFACEPWQSARRIKVNPDAPQRHVRIEALRRGIEVYVPTPRLRGGFRRLDPARIADADLRAAAGLSRMGRFAEEVSLDDLPPMDALVVGSVAVTRDGARCGKGEGYADIELAILAELGHRPVPIATTVHDVQVVDALPQQATDLTLSLIATPTHTHVVRSEVEGAAPRIHWDRFDDGALDAMPVLRTLRDRRSERADEAGDTT
jgi:5-formyltetrahydrofolate cyclo-ligase